MRIVGISEGFHDAGLCLLQDDRITYASHSERYSGRKNDKWLHPKQLDKYLKKIQSLIMKNHFLKT